MRLNWFFKTFIIIKQNVLILPIRHETPNNKSYNACTCAANYSLIIDWSLYFLRVLLWDVSVARAFYSHSWERGLISARNRPKSLKQLGTAKRSFTGVIVSDKYVKLYMYKNIAFSLPFNPNTKTCKLLLHRPVWDSGRLPETQTHTSCQDYNWTILLCKHYWLYVAW